MAANPDPSLTNPSPASHRLDARLRGRAQEWLTRKMALGFFPAPRTEADCRQRYHQLRELYADGEVLRAELWQVPPHAGSAQDRQLCERLAREVEEVRVQQEALRARAGLDALVTGQAPSSRVAFERSPSRLEIRIAPWRNGPLSAILPVWILVAGLILMNAVVGVFGSGPMPWGPLGGLLVGVPFAALVWFSAQYWLWIQGGTETIIASPVGLQVQADLMHWHGERTFRREAVRHLRYSRPSKGQAGSSVVLAAAGRSSPTIAFHAEGKTWRFGSELDEASALIVIAALETHLAS